MVGVVAFRERDGEEGEAEEGKQRQDVFHLLIDYDFVGFRLSSKVWREALKKGEEGRERMKEERY
jgi:hypothetical protein